MQTDQKCYAQMVVLMSRGMINEQRDPFRLSREDGESLTLIHGGQ